MKNKNKLFLGSIYDVFCFSCLALLGTVLILLSLFSISLNMKSYDMVFSSRIKTGTHYGVVYGEKFEIWKFEKAEDGSLYTKRIYPK